MKTALALNLIRMTLKNKKIYKEKDLILIPDDELNNLWIKAKKENIFVSFFFSMFILSVLVSAFISYLTVSVLPFLSLVVLLILSVFTLIRVYKEYQNVIEKEKNRRLNKLAMNLHIRG
jgi:uncharacterized membrane protein